MSCNFTGRSDHLVGHFVAYWPPTRPSCQNKKCTCVNNRCIRSKISGNQGRPWLSRGSIECEIVTLAGSRWVSNYYITPATGSSDQMAFRAWSQCSRSSCGNQLSAERLGPQAPGWAAQENGKEILLYSQKSGGQYVEDLFSLQLPSHTVKPFVTLSNKMRGIFF